MAIQDRNLSVGTKLYARYKQETHTAEVVARDPDNSLGHPTALGYRVDGKEGIFNSPSAAGTAVTGKACNGWAFWTVGDGSEAKPAKSAPAESSATITPAPKPQGKRKGRKSQAAAEPPATDGQVGDEARDDAPPATQPDDQPVTCAECGEAFPGVAAATEHYYATHGKALDEPTG